MRSFEQTPEDKFLESALDISGKVIASEEVLNWLSERKREVNVKVDLIPFALLKEWRFQEHTGNLVHDSGRFFSIEGIDVRTNWGVVKNWQQPIINQPEVGILGLICKEIHGVLHFLLQCKIEPGNINFVQLSPTVQATRSNYKQVHKGRRPQFIDHFLQPAANKARVLLDQLQSEQAARFYKKRNRNMIVQVEDDFDPPKDFQWMTLGQIKRMLELDNVINMDTRTVISCIQYLDHGGVQTQNQQKNVHNLDSFRTALLRSAVDDTFTKYSFREILSWIADRKCEYELWVDRIPLNRVQRWIHDDYSIYHESGKYFSVVAANVTIENREVSSWTQPLVKSAQEGIIAFLIKEMNGVYHFLVHAKLEAGNFDIVELAPTVQCLNDDYRESVPEQKPVFLDYVLACDKNNIKYDSMQSEEGGRFFREQNRYMLILVDDDFPDEVPEDYIWMTLGQIGTFIQFNNYFNIEARSLLSAIRFA